MRLTCPNCGAQYEVPDDVIPASGRDVQCSNCGNTWFEGPEDADLGPAPRSAPEDTEPRRPTRPERHAPPPAPEHADDNDDEDEDLHPAPSRPAGTAKRELDPAIADILKQEAEIERAARNRRDADPLQSQPDLGLDAANPDARQAEESRRRMARLKGEDAPRPGETGTGARSDRLPDIEEINSTLRSTRERNNLDDDATAVEPSRARGFRLGFGLTLLVLAGGMLTFTYAGAIADRVPQLAPYLDAYVSEVEVLRLWVDQQIQAIVARFGAGPL
jgi:predicted Zn finger-like uncharacterized protein